MERSPNVAKTVPEQQMPVSSLAQTKQEVSGVGYRAFGYWDIVWYQLRRSKLTLAAIAVLMLLFLLCFGAPIIGRYILHRDPDRIDLRAIYRPPGKEHWLGTDELGRDQLTRLLYGGRISLAIALSGAFLAMTIGVSLGALAGFLGKWIDDLIMWIVNTMLSIPTIPLLLLVSLLFKPKWYVLSIFIALNGWMGVSRMVRAKVLSVKERDYVFAARALGVPNWRIVLWHIMPNITPIVITMMMTGIGQLILAESALSFLGLGVQPPTATWGNMLTRAQSSFVLGPYLVIFPGLLITITVLSLYLVGDGLRDALDPTMRPR